MVKRRIVGYFQSWSTYRTGNGNFEVEMIDPNLCTHLIYCFFGINSNAEVTILDSWNDIDKGAIKRFNDLRNKNPNLKTMAAIGGAKADNNIFSMVVNDANLRAQFANNIVKFAKKYGFNGIDLDWEYPTNKDAFTELLKLLRPLFTSNGLILSAAVAAGFDKINDSYDVPQLGRYLDFINVMTYDLHGSWETVTGENAPLYAGPADTTDYTRNLNVNSAIQYWIRLGAPEDKLNLGIATYGRSFTLQNARNNNGVGAPAKGAGNPGPYTKEGGYLSYIEICEARRAGNLQEQWNAAQATAYAFGGDQWVGYDNIAAVKSKAQYITSNRLGGAMVWAIDTDDFRNVGGEGKYPLLNTIKTELA